MKVKVIAQFRDKFTGKLYNPETEIEIEDEARIEDLVDRKLVSVLGKKQETPAKGGIAIFGAEFERKALIEALKSVEEKVANNITNDKLIEKIAALTPEKIDSIKVAIGIKPEE